MLEKNFNINIKQYYEAINLIPVFRKMLPGMESYRLAFLVNYFGLKREIKQYKQSIFSIYKDWYEKRNQVLSYNYDDVLNLLKIFKIITKH